MINSMISTNRYNSFDEQAKIYKNLDEEAKRCVTCLNLKEKDGIYFDSSLKYIRVKEAAISDHEFITLICKRVLTQLKSYSGYQGMGLPPSLFNLRKRLKELIKKQESPLETNTTYEEFNHLYVSELKKFKRYDRAIETIFQKEMSLSEGDKINLAKYIKSINLEYLFLQNTVRGVHSYLESFKQNEIFINEYGNIDELEIALDSNVPLKCCVQLKSVIDREGCVSCETINSIKEFLKKVPPTSLCKKSFGYLFASALTNYLAKRADKVTKDTYALEDIENGDINIRYSDLVASYNALDTLNNRPKVGNKKLSAREETQYLIEDAERRAALLKERCAIFNKDFDQSIKKYEKAIELLDKGSATKSKLDFVNKVQEFADGFCQSIPVKNSSKILKVDYDALVADLANDPVVKAYKDIISFINDLPDPQQFDLSVYSFDNELRYPIDLSVYYPIDLSVYPSDDEADVALEVLDQSFSHLKLSNQEIPPSSQSQDEILLDSKYSYHDRVCRWFDTSRDPFKDDPKYKKLKSSEAKEKIKLFHNFSSKADSFVLSHGVKIDDLPEYPGSSQYALPCIIKTNDKEYRGKVIYCVDKETGVIWHRCFKENGYETFRTDYINDTIWINDVDFPKLSDTSSKNKSKQKSASIKKKAQPVQGQPLIDDGSKVLNVTSTYVRISDPKNKAENILDIE